MNKALVPLMLGLLAGPFFLSCASQSGTSLPAVASPPGLLLTSESGLRLVVDPDHAGRLVSVSLGGVEVLKPGADLLAGSTFWAAPQAVWPSDRHWPPPAAWDSEAWTVVQADSKSMLLEGPADPDTGLALGKKFELTEKGFRVTYTVWNRGETGQSWAPWEVTRLPAGTLLRFESPDPTWTGKSRLLPTKVDDQVIEFRQTKENGRKMYRDGKGLITAAWQGLVLTKTWTDVPQGQFAPGEAEIEIWAGGGYTEMELQGPYTEIPPGGRLDWTVTWSLESRP